MAIVAKRRDGRRRCILSLGALVLLVSALLGPVSGGALAAPADATVGCTNGVGDVAGLVAAINAANAAGSGTITLTAGCVYTLTTVDNSNPNDPLLGANGLPQISGSVTIEGNGATITRSSAGGTPAFRIFLVAGTGSLTLRNVTVTNGSVASTGGGISAELGAQLTITGSTLSGNAATNGDGGAIGFFSGNGAHPSRLTITDSTIDGNSAIGSGGGIEIGTASVTLSNSSVSDNTASSGGGLFVSGDLTMTNSTVSGNRASQSGGAVWLIAGSLTMTNSTVSGNIASGGNGGGIFIEGLQPDAPASMTVTDSTLSGNRTSVNGGAIWFAVGSLTMAGSTISGNTAAGGGGIEFDSGNLIMTNNTVSGNTAAAGSGGAIEVHELSVGGIQAILTNDTLSGNSASAGAGGINIAGDSSLGATTVTLSNSLVVAQTAGADCAVTDATLSDGGYNLDSDGSCVDPSVGTSHTISASLPLTLGPLQDNGGPTQTMLPSPLSSVDVIPPASCVAPDPNSPGQFLPLTTDQRGVTRPQGANCDIGAVETQHNLGIRVLSCQVNPVRRPSWLACRLEVIDSQGHNISARDLTVTALNVAPLGQPWDGTNGNLVRPFVYSPALAPGGGYELLVNTVTLHAGTYVLSLRVEGDIGIEAVQFVVRGHVF